MIPTESCVDWRARWVRSHLFGGPRTVPPAAYLRRAFSLDAPPRSAVLHITALGVYEAQVNGQTVGDHVLDPGWTEYRKRVYFQSYDVTGLLHQGENTMGVILGDGWFSGYVGWRERQYFGAQPQLLAQLEVTLADGSSVVVGTDADWRCSQGPILENDLLMGEAYDARRELGDWSGPGYDDARWLAAELATDPGIVVERSPGVPVRRIETLHPIEAPDKATAERWRRERIFDLGQNLTGRVRIRVRASAGRHLVIRHAEVLDAHGWLYTDNLRGARATDQYTCRGDGDETWEPRFTFHGFRYVQVQGLQPDDQLQLEAVVLHSDMKPTGRFACSHALLNQLSRNVVWGHRGNFLDIPTDCPQRDERLGWTGDAQAFIRTACFHYDVAAFFRKWLQTLRDAQHPTGSVPSYAPYLQTPQAPPDGGPAWGDAMLICPWVLYQCYGDTGFLHDNYDAMTRYMTYLYESKVKDDIRCHPDLDNGGYYWAGHGDWLALDGSGRVDGGTPKDLIGTAFYAHDADILARSAALLGKPNEAADWRALHARIVAAFQRRFITPEGLMSAGTQTAYVLALHFQLVPDALRPVAGRELVRLIQRNGNKLATGFVGTPYLLHALEAAGHLDTAYALLEQEQFPSWLFPVKHGATTIWERWDGWTPDKGFQDKGMNSFNHYAYGAVSDWMVSTVAGLQFDTQEPGYRHTIFKPRPGGSITSAQAALETPHGRAAIHWRIEADVLQLDLHVPQRGRGTLSLPTGWKLMEGSGTDLKPGPHRRVARRV